MTESACPVPIAKVIGAIALVFLSGFATGFLGERIFDTLFPSPNQGTEFRIQATLDELSSQLDLNPSQMEQIRVVLDDAIMDEAELLNELKLNQLDARGRIAQYLTPEQNRLFDKMLELAPDTP